MLAVVFFQLPGKFGMSTCACFFYNVFHTNFFFFFFWLTWVDGLGQMLKFYVGKHENGVGGCGRFKK